MSLPYPSLRQGLIRAWCPSLGASGLSLIDRSGRGSHGTLVAPSDTSWSASGSGVSLAFNGSTQYATLPFSATFGSSATLSMWVKRDAATPAPPDGNTGFFNANASDGGQESHYPYSNGTAFFRLLRAVRVSFTPLSSVTRTNWHNVTITTDGTTYAVYQGGALAYSTAAEATVSLSSPLLVGRSSLTNPYFCAARFDDIRLYNRAIAPAEIRLLASRRGIGLTPSAPYYDDDADLQQYPIVAPPNRVHANVAGVWVPGQVRANEAGTWGNGETRVNQGGEWL